MNTLVRSLVSQGCCEVDGIGFDDLICTDNIINFFFYQLLFKSLLSLLSEFRVLSFKLFYFL